MRTKLTFEVEIVADTAQDALDAYEDLIRYAIDLSNSAEATATVFEPETTLVDTKTKP